jgi:hypothetical protein
LGRRRATSPGGAARDRTRRIVPSGRRPARIHAVRDQPTDRAARAADRSPARRALKRKALRLPDRGRRGPARARAGDPRSRRARTSRLHCLRMWPARAEKCGSARASRSRRGASTEEQRPLRHNKLDVACLSREKTDGDKQPEITVADYSPTCSITTSQIRQKAVLLRCRNSKTEGCKCTDEEPGSSSE